MIEKKKVRVIKGGGRRMEGERKGGRETTGKLEY